MTDIKRGPNTDYPVTDLDRIWDKIPGDCINIDEDTVPDDGDILNGEGLVYDSLEDEWIGPLDWLTRRSINY